MIENISSPEISRVADVAGRYLPSRRELLRTKAVFGVAGFAGVLAGGHAHAVDSPSGSAIPRYVRHHHPRSSRPMAGALDPSSVPKYRTPLFLLGEMPCDGRNSYRIAIRQFRQQILPIGMPATTVWVTGPRATGIPSIRRARPSKPGWIGRSP
ncbi:hypothetical protein ACFRCG_06465 [Embleya sp. NPDC056575]|uniref:hypothetical protein n=1 Tax=unclassified Embleya TaxID=2699296 RepID=UPI003692F3A4